MDFMNGEIKKIDGARIVEMEEASIPKGKGFGDSKPYKSQDVAYALLDDGREVYVCTYKGCLYYVSDNPHRVIGHWGAHRNVNVGDVADIAGVIEWIYELTGRLHSMAAEAQRIHDALQLIADADEQADETVQEKARLYDDLRRMLR